MVEINQEIKNRIKLSIAAYAYEYKSDPIMSDDEFGALPEDTLRRLRGDFD